MKRKLASLLMAVVMTLSLAAPAFASNYWEYADTASTNLEQTLTFAATTKVPTIALSMPVVGTNPVILNPYQIEYTGEVTLNGQDGGAAATADQTKQIISPVYAIKNESDVPLKVAVKTTSTADGEFKFATAAVTNAEEKNKTAYVQIEFGVDTTGPIGTSSEQKIADAAKTAAGSTVLTLKAGDVSTTANSPISLPRPAVSGSTVTPNYLLFQFVGTAAKNPTKGWTADDKFTTAMVFTFLPGGNSAAGGASASASVTLAAGDTTKTATINALNVGAATVADQTIAITLPDGAEGLTIESATNFSLTPSGGTNNTAGNVNIALSGTTLTLTGANIKTVLNAEAGITGGSGDITIKYKSSASQASPDKTVTLTVSFTGVTHS